MLVSLLLTCSNQRNYSRYISKHHYDEKDYDYPAKQIHKIVTIHGFSLF